MSCSPWWRRARGLVGGAPRPTACARRGSACARRRGAPGLTATHPASPFVPRAGAAACCSVGMVVYCWFKVRHEISGHQAPARRRSMMPDFRAGPRPDAGCARSPDPGTLACAIRARCGVAPAPPRPAAARVPASRRAVSRVLPLQHSEARRERRDSLPGARRLRFPTWNMLPT
jgi:hypothetical protein